MANAIQYILDSIAYGSLFALMAMGLALLFGVMGLMNFAYGELIMAGAYVMFYTRGWGWLGMIAMTIVIVTVLSLLMELVAFRPVRRASPVTLLITSFAVSYSLQEIGWMTVGTGPQKGVQPYPWLTNQFDIDGVLVSRLEIATWIVTLALLGGMILLLKRTTLGIQLRASTEDFRMAQLVGVRANWVISAAFGGGVIGGLGSLPGAALGGFVLGAIINILGATLPISLKSHTQLFAFLAVIAILVLVPDGLVSVRGRSAVALWRRLRRTPPLAEEGAT